MKQNETATLGDLLRQHRQRLGLSQEELCRARQPRPERHHRTQHRTRAYPPLPPYSPQPVRGARPDAGGTGGGAGGVASGAMDGAASDARRAGGRRGRRLSRTPRCQSTVRRTKHRGRRDFPPHAGMLTVLIADLRD